MSVESRQPSQYGAEKARIESVYKKFQKAQENVQNFQEMLTGFSTRKKPEINQTQQHNNVQVFTLFSPSFRNQQQAAFLQLSDGWQYSGEVFEQKFHGFGNLMLNGQSIYIGQFKNGRMNGMGKLNYHQIFDEMVNTDKDWMKYQGEFKNGMITGFGNLFLLQNEVLVGYFVKGQPQYFTKIDSGLIMTS